MGTTKTLWDNAWRDLIDPALPATEANEYWPEKVAIRGVGANVDDRLNTLEAGQAGGAVAYQLYSQLAARTDLPVGTQGTVTDDNGTHTDPVVGGTVANQGIYRWSASPAGWERIGDFMQQPTEAPPWAQTGMAVVEIGAGGNPDVVLIGGWKGFSGGAASVITSAKSTVTISIASPGVVSWTAHDRNVGETIVFSTTGALPTGLTAGTTYYVIDDGYTDNAFQVSATAGGAGINTSGSQSGVHTAIAGGDFFVKAFTGVGTGGEAVAVIRYDHALYAAGSGADSFTLTESSGAVGTLVEDVSKPEILRVANGVFTSKIGATILGAVPGGSVPNLCPMGKNDLIRAGLTGADTAQVVIADADAIAAGFTAGVQSPTGAVPGGAPVQIGFNFPEALPPGKWAFFRIPVVTPVADDFGIINGVLRTRNASQSVPLVLERKISSTFAYFIGARASSATGDEAWVTGLSFVQVQPDPVDLDVPRLIFCAPQGHYGAPGQSYIMRADYPEPVDDTPLVDDIIHLIDQQRKPFFEKQVRASRLNETSSRAVLEWLSTDGWDGNVAHLYADHYIDANVVKAGPGRVVTRPINAGPALRKSKAVTIKTTDPSTLTGPIYVLSIGDSLVETTGGPVFLDKRLKEYVGDANVFSRGSVTCRNYDVTKTIDGEGRSGKEAGDYTHAKIASGGTGLLTIGAPNPITNFGAYLAADQTTRKTYTPFARPTAGGDQPAFVKNGFIVDFAWYHTNMGWAEGENFNLIHINLGTNDIADPINGLTNAITSLDILYRQARSRYPNAQIQLITNPLPFATYHATENQYKWDQLQVPFIKALMAKVRQYRTEQTAVVTFNTTTDVVTDTNNGFALHTPVKYTTTGTLPTPLVPDTTYYVETISSASGHKLSATPGGATLNLSGSPSGVHTRHTIPDTKVLHIGMYQFVSEEGGDEVAVVSTDAQTGSTTETITAFGLIHKGDALAMQYADATLAAYSAEVNPGTIPAVPPARYLMLTVGGTADNFTGTTTPELPALIPNGTELIWKPPVSNNTGAMLLDDPQAFPDGSELYQGAVGINSYTRSIYIDGTWILMESSAMDRPVYWFDADGSIGTEPDELLPEAPANKGFQFVNLHPSAEMRLQFGGGDPIIGEAGMPIYGGNPPGSFMTDTNVMTPVRVVASVAGAPYFFKFATTNNQNPIADREFDELLARNGTTLSLAWDAALRARFARDYFAIVRSQFYYVFSGPDTTLARQNWAANNAVTASGAPDRDDQDGYIFTGNAGAKRLATGLTQGTIVDTNFTLAYGTTDTTPAINSTMYAVSNQVMGLADRSSGLVARSASSSSDTWSTPTARGGLLASTRRLSDRFELYGDGQVHEVTRTANASVPLHEFQIGVGVAADGSPPSPPSGNPDATSYYNGPIDTCFFSTALTTHQLDALKDSRAEFLSDIAGL